MIVTKEVKIIVFGKLSTTLVNIGIIEDKGIFIIDNLDNIGKYIDKVIKELNENNKNHYCLLLYI